MIILLSDIVHNCQDSFFLFADHIYFVKKSSKFSAYKEVLT